MGNLLRKVSQREMVDMQFPTITEKVPRKTATQFGTIGTVPRELEAHLSSSEGRRDFLIGSN